MYLVADCPHNLEKKGKTPLNTVNVIPSPDARPLPSGEESEGVKPVNVVTQAQARNNPMINKKTQTERSSNNTWKKQRDKDKKPLKSANSRFKLKNQTKKLLRNKTRKSKERGQVLEPLHAMLDAFEVRLKPNQTLEDRVRAYPDPQLETKRLEIFQKMIEGTQALLQ